MGLNDYVIRAVRWPLQICSCEKVVFLFLNITISIFAIFQLILFCHFLQPRRRNFRLSVFLYPESIPSYRKRWIEVIFLEVLLNIRRKLWRFLRLFNKKSFTFCNIRPKMSFSNGRVLIFCELYLEFFRNRCFWLLVFWSSFTASFLRLN